MRNNRWGRIMEAINNGIDDAVLKKIFRLKDVEASVYRKYATAMRFDGEGGYVECASMETVSAMASFNHLIDHVEIL